MRREPSGSPGSLGIGSCGTSKSEPPGSVSPRRKTRRKATSSPRAACTRASAMAAMPARVPSGSSSCARSSSACASSVRPLSSSIRP